MVVRLSNNRHVLSVTSFFTAVGIACSASIRPSVTFPCFVETNEDTIMQFSLSGSTIILVSEEVKIIRYSQ